MGPVDPGIDALLEEEICGLDMLRKHWGCLRQEWVCWASFIFFPLRFAERFAARTLDSSTGLIFESHFVNCHIHIFSGSKLIFLVFVLFIFCFLFSKNWETVTCFSPRQWRSFLVGHQSGCAEGEERGPNLKSSRITRLVRQNVRENYGSGNFSGPFDHIVMLFQKRRCGW